MDVKPKYIQYLITFEIFKETFKIINSNRKIFAIAALCFIHPLNYVLSYIMGTLNLLLRNFREHGNFSHLFSHNWSFFLPSNVLNVLSIIFLFGYSIISTAAVAYTVAAIYTGREPSPKDTVSVLGKVWKRVLVTYLCVLVAFLVYNTIAGFVFWVIVTTIPLPVVMGAVLGVFLFFYFGILMYLVAVLQLSCVVSVLEESCGFKAMAKSRLLLKGKAAAAAATTVVLVICLSFGTITWLESLVREMPLSPTMMIPLMYALVSLLLLFLILVFLLWKLVLETMLYLVCKSNLEESIDLSALSDQDCIIPLSTTKS